MLMRGRMPRFRPAKKENKFGVAIGVAPEIYARLSKLDGLDLRGVAVHIGSQLQQLDPLEKCYQRMGQLVSDLRAAGHDSITHVDLGGGLGRALQTRRQSPQPRRLWRDGDAGDKGLGCHADVRTGPGDRWQ